MNSSEKQYLEQKLAAQLERIDVEAIDRYIAEYNAAQGSTALERIDRYIAEYNAAQGSTALERIDRGRATRTINRSTG